MKKSSLGMVKQSKNEYVEARKAKTEAAIRMVDKAEYFIFTALAGEEEKMKFSAKVPVILEEDGSECLAISARAKDDGGVDIETTSNRRLGIDDTVFDIGDFTPESIECLAEQVIYELEKQKEAK